MVTFHKLKKIPAYKILAEAILEQVLDGRLKKGDLLPTEAELCVSFGVNRSTVREGIRLLEESGVLRRVQGKRLKISRPTRKELGAQVGRAMVLHEITLREVTEAIDALEPAVIRLAATKPLPTELRERFITNLQLTEQAVATGASLTELDTEFHDLIMEAADSRALQIARESVGQLFFQIYGAVIDALEVAPKRLLFAHQAIFNALDQGDQEQALLWSTRHLKDFKLGIELCKFELDKPIAFNEASFYS